MELNPPQREAVEHPGGPLLVLAGAGSGKTRVLACRAAFLVHSSRARPWNILALTFTNKAAAELRSRVERIVGPEGVQVAAGTFHGMFARIMRREGRNIGVDPDYTIVDADDRRRLIKAILKELGIPSNAARPPQVDWVIGRAKESLVTPERFAEAARHPLEQVAAQVYKRYETRLRRMNGLDFDDLLARPLQAFAEYPAFLDRLRDRFRYVLVDEFQDTNRVQYLLVKEIALEHRNLSVVGDDDQAIYGFRGATVQNILDFERDWPEAKVVRLEQNYRSNKPILDIAWAVIHHNSRRRAKKLWTDRRDGGGVELLETHTDEEEALRIVGLIQDEQRLRGTAYRDIAILYRTNAQSLQFERALRAAQIPYHVVGGLRFYERREVKDLLAYLRLMVNPVDDISLLRVINYPPRGIGQGLLEALQAEARRNSVPLIQAVGVLLADDSLSSRRRKALEGFTRLMEQLREQGGERSYDDLAAEIVTATGLRERLLDEEKDDPSLAESKIANLENLLSEIHRYAETNPDAGLEDFLEEVALISDADDYDENPDRVNLLTLHSAKGLEFRVVFIGGLEEGLLPLEPPDGSMPDVEEERRLFYVGATRARDRLVLGYAVDRKRWGRSRWSGPSRFIAEIPPELLERRSYIRPRRYASYEIDLEKRGGGARRTGGRQVSRRGDPQPEEQGGELYKGMLVKHPSFGLGVVVECERRGLNSKVRVDFDDVGLKTLVIKYARLEAVS